MKNRKTNFIMLMLSSVLCFTACNNADGLLSVKIGNQEWASENLNVSTFRNGDAIPEAQTREAWVKAGEEGKPAWCYYDNDPENGNKYGRLYNWYAVTDPRGLAPSGWHIPSDEEWTTLADNLGGDDDAAGKKMKSKAGWYDNGNGSNTSGFSGLPGGNRYSSGTFDFIGNNGYWWSSTEPGPNYAWYRFLSYYNGSVSRSYIYETLGYSVRCLRDYEEDISSEQLSVKMGNQEWMTNNLNVSTFRNGDDIPQATTDEEWIKAGENKQPAWCYYNNDSDNGAKYGKLYNGYAVNDARGLAPKGFHIPSDAEWTMLSDNLGGEDVAGHKMKSQAGWDYEGNGSDASGFSGLPGGSRDYVGTFYDIGDDGNWWSSTEYNTYYAWDRNLNYDYGNVVRNYNNKTNGFSVRCLRD